MSIIGCDFHDRFQKISKLDAETGGGSRIWNPRTGGECVLPGPGGSGFDTYCLGLRHFLVKDFSLNFPFVVAVNFCRTSRQGSICALGASRPSDNMEEWRPLAEPSLCSLPPKIAPQGIRT